jgi:predicted ATPase
MRAFTVDGLSALSYAKRHTTPIPPNQLVDVPADLSALVMALIDPDPDRRPTGDRLVELLAGKSEGPPLEARRAGSLVGRARELAELRGAFDGVTAGNAALVRVRGPSGVGKSALLREFREYTRDSGAIVLRGRCYERESVPYKAFDAMLDDLARKLAGRGLEEVNGYLPPGIAELTSVFPVLGGVRAIDRHLQLAPPLSPSLPAAEIQKRAVEALAVLFSRIAARRRLVIEIDDLQWADADSADALSRILSEVAPRGLCVALSYRTRESKENDEVDALLNAIDEQALGFVRLNFDLGPLDEAETRELARATLASADASVELVDSIVRESSGVPFFCEELALLAAHQLDAGETPTVAIGDVISRRVSALVEEERALVETLAVANNPLPLSVAVSVAGIEERGVMRALWSLRRQDFVRSSGAGPGDHVQLRHDRLRESVNSSLSAERREGIHLNLGHALAGWSGRDKDDHAWVFDAVRHLGAAQRILDDEWRIRAAHLSLEAGVRARASSAFSLALESFQRGIALLGGSGWVDNYELELSLHDGAAEAAYLSSSWSTVAELVIAIKDEARSATDKLGAWEAEIDGHIARNQYDEAVDAGREALSEMGVDLPAQPGLEEIGAEFQAAFGELAPMGPEAFVQLALATDPLHVAAMRVLSRITSAAYFSRPNLLPVIACRMVRASIQDGLAPATPYALSIFGIVLNTLGMHVEAHTWGQVALSLMDRFEDRSLDVRTGHVVHDLVCNWTVPLQGTLPDVLAVYELGKATGDVEYGAYAAHAYVHNAIYAAHPLRPLLDEAVEIGDFMRGHQQVNALHVHEPFEQLLRAFTGETPDPASLDDSSFSEAESLAAAEAAGSRSAMCLNRVVMGIARYHLGTPAQASEIFEAARPYLDGMPSVWHTPIFHQYAALSILGLAEAQRAPLMHHVDTAQAALAALAEVGPMNFAHRVPLLEAERARAEGRIDDAISSCHDAIEGAREHGWVNDEGIALQIEAHCLRALGDTQSAKRRLQRAAELFDAWGASAKARQLRADNEA